MTGENPGVDRILFVDDEQMVIEPMCKLLERSGYHVTSVNSGRKAIEIIKKNGTQIHMVILDMLMPGMDGLETFIGIREIQPQMPVLLASGYNHAPQMDGIRQKGCNGFIQKPYSFSELLPIIKNILEEARSPAGSEAT